MIGYNNPKVLLLPNPKGIDLVIQEMQIKFAEELPWLQKSFGRAFRQRDIQMKQGARTNDLKPRDIYYPEVFSVSQEPLNLMPNDNLKSYSFFYTRDPQTFVNYDQFENQKYISSPVSLIFWFDLNKVNEIRKFRYTEELKNDVLELLQQFPYFIASDIYESIDRVFERFTLTDNFKNYLKFPYSGFRIDGNLTFVQFEENCEGLPRKDIFIQATSKIPTSEEELINLLSVPFNTVVTLDPGNELKTFVIAVEEFTQLMSVKSSGAFTEDLSDNYTYRSTIAGYDIYAMQIAVPYSEPQTHTFILK